MAEDGWDNDASGDGGWDDGGADGERNTKKSKSGDGWGEIPEDGADGMEQDEEMKVLPLQRNYSYNILDAANVRNRQKKIIEEVAEELFISLEESACLLRHFGWNKDKLTVEWLKQGGDKVRAKVGLSKRHEEKAPTEVQCLMAFCDKVPAEKATKMACGHWVCNDCWTEFLTAQVNNGRGCIFTVCPGWKCQKKLCQHSVKMGCKCEEMVPDDLFRKFVTDKKALGRYEWWLLESFVEGNKVLKWCPKPGCERVAEYSQKVQREIICNCGTRYCFACRQESHVPAPCDLAGKYKAKGSSDLATEQLLAATTKKCPKCEVLITKNKACNHMNCAKCRHQFCWLCKGDWKDHGSQTGGYYVCKKYNEDKGKGVLTDEEQKMVDTQKFMQSTAYQKYLYYRTRFDHHSKAAVFAQAFIDKVEKSASNLKEYSFLIDAGRKLIDARRVLQWTFSLAYFLKDSAHKKRFEYQLDLLNGFSEELQDMLEKEDNWSKLAEKKSDILKRTRTIDEFRKKMVEFTDEPSFQTLLMNDWGGQDDGSWFCTACTYQHQTEDEKKAKICAKCSACRAHGEPACRVPECAPPGGLQ